MFTVRNTTVVKRPWFVNRINRCVLLLILDTSPALDTVYHSMLLKRLHSRFGIRGSALAWFHSYLKDRTQFVSIKGTSSSLHELICGVPQGSVLGSLLYVLYTCSVGDIICKHGLSFHLYADDQQLYTSFFKNKRRWLRQRDASVEMCVSDIHTWMAINKLKLNTDKTELLYFHTKFCPYIELNPMQRGSDVIHPSSHAGILVLSLTQQ